MLQFFSSSAPNVADAALSPLFASYLSTYGKSYADADEYNLRFQTWADRHQFITEFNHKLEATGQASEAVAHRVGHNEFSDWTREEIENNLLMHTQYDQSKFLSDKAVTLDEPTILDVKDLPAEVNWVTAGAVNEPRTQGICRAAHTFSATASMEGAHFIKHGQLLKLSEQQCVDCDEDSFGCNGGYAENCLFYASGNVGLMLETDYPWTGSAAKICDADYSKKAAIVKKVNSVKPKSAEQLKAAIALGPVSVTIDASSYTFLHYFGGIITDPDCGTALTHEVAAVGYGVDKDSAGNEIPYYLIKNSWGKKWGENGYVRVKMGGEDDWGICGTQEVGRYPDI